jgi:SAM-dependent methyltransferase
VADDDGAADVFTEIYQTDHWRGGSGEGSTTEATAPYRRIVERFVVSPEVRRVVDVGCGDWQLGSLVNWTGVHYTGLDVVKGVIDTNARRWGGPRTDFEVADARDAYLPSGDLLLVKDVLQHWPNADVAAFLARELPRFPYALLTNDLASVHWSAPVNEDIALGQWRTLDLETAPFEVVSRHRWDYDVRGEWTKRVLLVTSPRRWKAGRVMPRSVRRIAASVEV